MLNLDLHGKTAVISGSTAGIGRACAAGLAERGANVVITGRTEPRVNAAVGELRKRFPDVRSTGVACELGTIEGVEQLIRRVPDADILVNNLGIFAPKAFAEIDDAEWMRFFEINVMSGVRLSRHYIPYMREENWGRIVFISSESALQIPVEMIHYGVTKTAQVALARGLAESLAGTGVTVNSILAGPTKSEGVGTFVARLAEQRGITFDEMERRFFEHDRPTSLIQRFLTPEEIANLVVYVCTPAASGTTGAALRVDGGVVRAIT